MENVNLSMQLHHIGIAVPDFAISLSFYEKIGYYRQIEVYDPEQNVMVCLLKHKESSAMLELLKPYNEQSPINSIIKKMGATPYHICYAVPNIGQALFSLRQSKFMVMSLLKPSNAFDNRLVCFLRRKDIGLIEIIEE